MDHVGVVVDDLDAALAFFAELGLEAEEKSSVSGRWMDSVVGLDDVSNRASASRIRARSAPLAFFNANLRRRYFAYSRMATVITPHDAVSTAPEGTREARCSSTAGEGLAAVSPRRPRLPSRRGRPIRPGSRSAPDPRDGWAESFLPCPITPDQPLDEHGHLDGTDPPRNRGQGPPRRPPTGSRTTRAWACATARGTSTAPSSPRATTGTRGRTRARGATREPRARPRSGDRRARRPQPGAGSAPAARLTSARRCSRKARSAAFAVSSIARRYD